MVAALRESQALFDARFKLVVGAEEHAVGSTCCAISQNRDVDIKIAPRWPPIVTDDSLSRSMMFIPWR